MKEQTMIFRELEGKWVRVDSRNTTPPTLAEVLNSINIILDDDAQFCRIIRYWTDIRETITYRAHAGQITISICQSHIQ